MPTPTHNAMPPLPEHASAHTPAPSPPHPTSPIGPNPPPASPPLSGHAVTHVVTPCAALPICQLPPAPTHADEDPRRDIDAGEHTGAQCPPPALPCTPAPPYTITACTTPQPSRSANAGAVHSAKTHYSLRHPRRRAGAHAHPRTHTAAPSTHQWLAAPQHRRTASRTQSRGVGVAPTAAGPRHTRTHAHTQPHPRNSTAHHRGRR